MDLATRKKLAESLRGREARRRPISGLELREVDGALTLDGWASVVEVTYDMGWYEETIKRGAFTKTLSEQPDVQLLMNHEGLPLARTISGTLQLTEDNRGLHVSADLNPDDPDVQRLAPKVQRGDIDQMSFAFRVVKQQWLWIEDDGEGMDQREILEVNIDRGDVSVVNQGANAATSFSLRDLAVRFELPGAEQYGSALVNLRAGVLDDATMATLQNVLDLIDASDTGVDRALITLSDLMGVTNPDIAQDAALERSYPLDLYRAKALALRARS